MENNTLIAKDLLNKKLTVKREFDAPVDKVWKAWTESNLLDKWWAPKPWQAVTQIFEFKDGGTWLYYMVGPTGEKHFSRVQFNEILPLKSFSYTCRFCDEDGNTDENSITMHWLITFTAAGNTTHINVDLRFDNDADMEKILVMGFEGGFTMGLNNLEELLDTVSL